MDTLLSALWTLAEAISGVLVIGAGFAVLALISGIVEWFAEHD